MRKWALVVLLMLVAGVAFGATATVTETEYGYSITGGTSATAVAPTMKGLYITSIEFYPGGAGTDVAIFKSEQVSNTTLVTCLVLNQYQTQARYANEGTLFKNLEVTMTSASDVVTIHVAGKIPN